MIFDSEFASFRLMVVSVGPVIVSTYVLRLIDGCASVELVFDVCVYIIND